MGVALDLERRRQPRFDYEGLANYVVSAAHRQRRLRKACKKADSGRNGSEYDEEESITIKSGAGPPLVGKVLDLLPAFWKDDLDTPCAFCGKDFELVDPPIRTVAIEQSDPLIVRVSNWHMKCVERSGLGLISVSHVWHDAIAAANLSEEDTPEASRCLHRVLSEILPTVQATFRDHFGQVELWHDYLSIPQWQRPMQQALLVMLPHIYKIARLCLIHLDDISTKQIVAAATICAKNILWRSAIYQFWSMPGDGTISRHDCMTRSQRSNLTSHQSAFDWSAWWKDEPKKSQSSTPDEYRRYKALVGFYSAKWFQRMWVSLEYPQCQQACVYTKDNGIIWDGESSNCDSFSLIFDGFQQRMRQCIEDIGFNEFRNFFFDMPLPLLGPLADMRRNARSMDGVALCYGEALSFRGGQKVLVQSRSVPGHVELSSL